MPTDRISPHAILERQPIFDAAPFPSCHAATLAEAGDTLLAAWFGGTREGAADVCVWLSRRPAGEGWSTPFCVGEGVLPGEPTRWPCWNPVLFQPLGGPLLLFYKIGPSPSKWWGMLRTSDDAGRTWSDPRRLPAPVLGPAKNKPVQLAGGDILCPCSAEVPDAGWHVYTERSTDGGRTFTASPWIEQGDIAKATQPSILVHDDHVLQMLGRTTAGRIFESWSRDAGHTWAALRLTGLPNCNSGIDAVSLLLPCRGVRHALIYNHSNLEKVRYPLNLAISADGATWLAAAELESEPPGQYSYPCVIESQTGLLHVAYTWKRRTIRHAVIDPSRLEPRPLDEAFTCPPPGSPTHRADEFQ